jgi:hypothetical protein
MAEVMTDRCIRFNGADYKVSLTWHGPEPVVTVQPPNDLLAERIRTLAEQGRLKLALRDGYHEIDVP